MTAPAIDTRSGFGTGHLQAGHRAGGGRLPRLLRGPAEQPAWARPAVLVLLGLTAVLYLAGLSANGWANDFYSAAVQAGSTSWKAFFFGSFDASSFITVDKTPASLWVMELSARIFGLNYWSVLVPQALEGVACVGVLYAAVRRWFGPAAGLLAGAALALTPVAALMFRFNNPDAMLVLLMTIAAYALTRAIEDGRTRWLALVGAAIGFGFLAKMLQAVLVVPPFAVAYLVAGPPRLGRRLLQLLAGGAAMVLSAGWWVAAVMLTPAADRPYVGGSTNDSILQLALGYNGLGRLDGNETGSVGFGGGGGGRGGGGAFGGGTGITRLFSSEMGSQISWLLPAALVALAAMIWLSRKGGRTDRMRAAAIIWGGGLLVTGGVFSYMSGIIHPYYTVALAPFIGALAGIGAVAGWQARGTVQGRVILCAGLVAATLWSATLLGRTPSWHPEIHWIVLVTGLLAAGAFAAGPLLTGLGATVRRRAALALIPVPLALVALFAGPAAYSAATVSTSHTGALPSAGPASAGGFGGPGGGFGRGAFGGRTGTGNPGGNFSPPGAGGGGTGTAPGGTGAGGTGTAPGGTGTGGTGTGRTGTAPGGTRTGRGGFGGGGGLAGNTQVSSALVTLLKNGSGSYKWAAATVGTQSASPLQLATRLPMLAIGGFNGSDPSPALAQFKKLVAAGEIHYFIGANSASFGGGTGSAAQITSWVAAHYTAKTVGGVTVYNLAP
jgi:4-amino-4-deoxy-L-arabinose transferase-like glycosyltransferase